VIRRARSTEISTFTLKGSLIPETYAAFRDWDFGATDGENLEHIKRTNAIGARSTNWLLHVIKVLHRRFAPSTYDRALVTLAQAHCPLEIWRPILLWHMARDEFLLRDFLVRWLAVADLGYGVLDSAMVEVAAYCLEVAA
jgi:hypothetical protein